MQGFFDYDESFDSCVSGTLTLFLSSTTPSPVSLLSMPLTLSCRTLNVLSSIICSADGAGVGGGEGGYGGDCWVFETEQGSQVQSLFTSPILCCILELGTYCIYSSRTSVALVAYSSTSDISGTYRTGVLGSSA